MRVTICSLLWLATLAAAVPADDEDGELHKAYGFDGLILSKYNNGLFGLTSADVDGDGRRDLAVVNNAKAKIEFLLNQDPEAEDADPELVNELPDEVHFKRESLATEQKVWSLALADMDGDGRADAIFTGDSDKLTVAYAGEDGQFARRRQFDLEDGRANPESVRVGDLNGDGRLDVVVFARDFTLLFVQDERGVLRAADQLANASLEADGFDLVDLDGDGLLDLLYVVSESEWPLRVRLGQPETSFGPELRSGVSEIRAFAAEDLDGDGAAEVVVVGRRSGRATLLDFQSTEAEGAQGELALSSLRVLAFGQLSGSKGRDGVLADLDRDGNVDLLVAEPAAARFVVYRGTSDGQFHGQESYPSLLGTSQPCVADLDDDGLGEILLAAPDEGSVAVAQVDQQGQIGFPAMLEAPGGDLLAVEVGDTDGDGVPETWCVVGNGRGRSRTRMLRRFVPGGSPVDVQLEDSKADPAGLMLADLNQDGRDDVLLFVPTELPLILLSDGEGFRPLDTGGPGYGLLEGVAREQVYFGDVDGQGRPELLVPGSNFARAIALDAEDDLVVVRQFNLPAADAEVSAVTAADLDGDGTKEVLMVDKSSGRMVAVASQDGRTLVRARVDLGGFSPSGLLPSDLDGDGTDDLVLWSDDAVATVLSGGEELRFVPGAGYESPVKDAYLDRVAAGDVNGDGGVDLVFTETHKHLMHIAAVQEAGLVHVMRFPVFEARMFESSKRSSREPRELHVADVTGDGWQDVAVLVHDRVIVYPQEPPR